MSSFPARAPLASWRFAVRCLSALVVLMIALGFGSVGIVSGAQPGDDAGAIAGSLRPLDLVKSSVSRVLAITQSPSVSMAGSEDRRTQIRRVAHDLFAFNEMARRVMGQHSKECLPQEQHEFVRLFADVFTRAYATAVERYSGERVAFVSEEVTGSLARARLAVGSLRHRVGRHESRVDISEPVHVEHADVLVRPTHGKNADGTAEAVGPGRGREPQGQRAGGSSRACRGASHRRRFTGARDAEVEGSAIASRERP